MFTSLHIFGAEEDAVVSGVQSVFGGRTKGKKPDKSMLLAMLSGGLSSDADEADVPAMQYEAALRENVRVYLGGSRASLYLNMDIGPAVERLAQALSASCGGAVLYFSSFESDPLMCGVCIGGKTVTALVRGSTDDFFLERSRMDMEAFYAAVPCAPHTETSDYNRVDPLDLEEVVQAEWGVRLHEEDAAEDRGSAKAILRRGNLTVYPLADPSTPPPAPEKPREPKPSIVSFHIFCCDPVYAAKRLLAFYQSGEGAVKPIAAADFSLSSLMQKQMAGGRKGVMDFLNNALVTKSGDLIAQTNTDAVLSERGLSVYVFFAAGVHPGVEKMAIRLSREVGSPVLFFAEENEVSVECGVCEDGAAVTMLVRGRTWENAPDEERAFRLHTSAMDMEAFRRVLDLETATTDYNEIDWRDISFAIEKECGVKLFCASFLKSFREETKIGCLRFSSHALLTVYDTYAHTEEERTAHMEELFGK